MLLSSYWMCEKGNMKAFFAISFCCFLTGILPAQLCAAENLWLREDFTETPPEVPVQQKHLANPALLLRRHGPSEDKIKRSFHANKPGDPHYVWSGLCTKKWAITFEHQKQSANLSKSGKVRWRTKQGADRVLYVIVKSPKNGWLVSDQGTPASKNWIVSEIDLTECQWYKLDIETITKGELVKSPDLTAVQIIGCSDLKPGGRSKACSRLDWIEVFGD
jgi:hypothetical protein